MAGRSPARSDIGHFLNSRFALDFITSTATIFGDPSRNSPAVATPVSEMVQSIRQYLVDELMDEDVDIDTDTRLFEEGLVDSMNLVKLLSFLENRFEVNIPVSMVNDENLASIDNMVGLVNRVKS